MVQQLTFASGLSINKTPFDCSEILFKGNWIYVNLSFFITPSLLKISLPDARQIIALPCHPVSQSSSWILLKLLDQSCYMVLFKLLPGFFKVVLCICSPLPNKTKMKFDQDVNACWSFFFELKVLNESKYSMPLALPWYGMIHEGKIEASFQLQFILDNLDSKNQ